MFFRRDRLVLWGALVGMAMGFCCAPGARADELEDKPVVRQGISIRLPKGWRMDERGTTLLVARAAERDKDAQGEFRALLTISSAATDKIDAAAQQAQAAREFKEYKVEEKPEAITVNGLEGVKFGGTMQTGSVKVRSRQYLLLHKGRMYTLTFMCLATHWNSYAPLIEACAATFTVLPPK